MNYLKWLILIGLFISSMVWATGFNFLDSLDRLPPNLRYYYQSKERKDLLDFSLPDLQNVRMVGKWGRGPSSRVTGRGNLVFLSLGSEVAIVDVSDSIPQIIYEVQARGLVASSVLKDSFLFIGGPGIEIWNIANPLSPVFRNRIITNVSDLCIKDTLLYAIAGDSFRIFNIANIANPYRVGVSNDVGYYLSVSGNYAYVSDRWGLYIINIQNPASPNRINSWGSALLSAQTRDTFCYVSTYDPMNPDWLRFTILNVANPNSIQEKSHIDYAGGDDVYLLSYFAYVSGIYLPVGEFQIIDISNPSLPSVVSRCTTAGWNNGVWVNNPFGKAFVADDYEGLQIINISDPTNPSVDTAILSGEYALDVWVDRNYAYIADRRAGLKIVDISNPTLPSQVGEYDTLGRYWYDHYDIQSAVTRDSFAYIGAPIPLVKFGVIDVSNPFQPILMGTTSIFNGAEDMAIRDSFVYVAEDNKFEIFNVANPRQPRLVGSCNSLDMTGGLCVKDSFAYIASSFGWAIINISNPSDPRMINSISKNSSWGMSVVDTFAYIFAGYARDSLSIWSVANPYTPYRISSFSIRRSGYDVVVESGLAFIGTRFGLEIFDVFDPQNPKDSGFYSTPDYVRRVFYLYPYIYTACFGAGMCIFEQLPPGIEEQTQNIAVRSDLSIAIQPNPISSVCHIRVNGLKQGYFTINIYDVLGKKLKEQRFLNNISRNGTIYKISLKDLPQGILFFYLEQDEKRAVTKVIKTN